MWWTLAFGLLLAVANLAIYTAFRTYLRGDLDLKVRTVAATELASSTDGPDIHLHELPTDALAQRRVHRQVRPDLRADGRVRLASASLRGVPRAGAAATWCARPSTDARRSSRSSSAGVPDARPCFARGWATSTTPSWSASFAIEIDAHLAQLAWLLAAVWTGGLAATSALGYWLASRALAPVVGITQRAARIAQGDFSARLDPPASQDEVGEMTRSLNDVLDRLHGALEAHRRFASDASHELRAPITAMAGEIDVTLKHPRTADEYRDTLLVVGERLSALTALCEDLILLVHAQEGAPGLELREVSVLPQLQDGATRLAGPRSGP